MERELSVIGTAEADRLLALGDGDAALLYIHLRRNKQGLPEGFTPERASAAHKKLASAVLVAPEAAPFGGRPSYKPSEIAETALTNPAFGCVVRESERLLGRTLSPSDLQTLYAMLDWRGMSPGMLLLLVNYCVVEHTRRYGPEARPLTMSQIDREAAYWQNEGVRDEKGAEEYIDRAEAKREAANIAYRKLGISGREPTVTEKKYVSEWLSLGFTHGAIALAYDKTVINTGKLAWKYCDSILRRWHNAGLHSEEEIEARDKKPAKPRDVKGPDGQDEYTRMRETLKSLRGE